MKYSLDVEFKYFLLYNLSFKHHCDNCENAVPKNMPNSPQKYAAIVETASFESAP